MMEVSIIERECVNGKRILSFHFFSFNHVADNNMRCLLQRISVMKRSLLLIALYIINQASSKRLNPLQISLSHMLFLERE